MTTLQKVTRQMPDGSTAEILLFFSERGQALHPYRVLSRCVARNEAPGREQLANAHEYCLYQSFALTRCRWVFSPAKNCHEGGRGFESRRSRHFLIP